MYARRVYVFALTNFRIRVDVYELTYTTLPLTISSYTPFYKKIDIFRALLDFWPKTYTIGKSKIVYGFEAVYG